MKTVRFGSYKDDTESDALVWRKQILSWDLHRENAEEVCEGGEPMTDEHTAETMDGAEPRKRKLKSSREKEREILTQYRVASDAAYTGRVLRDQNCLGMLLFLFLLLPIRLLDPRHLWFFRELGALG